MSVSPSIQATEDCRDLGADSATETPTDPAPQVRDREGHLMQLVPLVTVKSAADKLWAHKDIDDEEWFVETIECQCCLRRIGAFESVFFSPRSLEKSWADASSGERCLPHFVYCEQCVRSGKAPLRKYDWSSKTTIKAWCEDRDVCLDSTLRFPCLGARICGLANEATKTVHMNFDPPKEGVSDYMCMWLIPCLIPLDLLFGCPCHACCLQFVHRKTELAMGVVNSVQAEPSCVKSFCHAYFCRFCMMAQLYKQWNIMKRDSIGEELAAHAKDGKVLSGVFFDPPAPLSPPMK